MRKKMKELFSQKKIRKYKMIINDSLNLDDINKSISSITK